MEFQKDGPYTYSYDNSLGKGQTIFILDDGFVDIPAVRNIPSQHDGHIS